MVIRIPVKVTITLSMQYSIQKYHEGVSLGCDKKTDSDAVSPVLIREKSTLDETGRLQFFFHSISSKYPIRDVLNEQNHGHKTEPHIEIGAENYINCCYQTNNIVPFINSKEKYLFLFTTCKNKELESHYGKRLIVGYIEKQGHISCKSHVAAQGKVRMFDFNDTYPLEQITSSPKNVRMKILSTDETTNQRSITSH